MRSRVLAKSALIALAIATIGGAILVSNELRFILGTSQSTTGIVLELHPDEHSQIVFGYRVNERDYVSMSMAGFGTPPIQNLSVGDVIGVTYLQSDPSAAVAGSIGPALLSDLQFLVVGFVAVFLATYTLMSPRRVYAENSEQAVRDDEPKA